MILSVGQAQFSQFLQGRFTPEFQQDHRTCAGLDIMGLGSCDLSVERCKMKRRKSGDYNNNTVKRDLGENLNCLCPELRQFFIL